MKLTATFRISLWQKQRIASMPPNFIHRKIKVVFIMVRAVLFHHPELLVWSRDGTLLINQTSRDQLNLRHES